MIEYNVKMTIAGKIIDAAICCGNLEKCERALIHLQGLTDKHHSIDFVIVPCLVTP